MARASVYAVTTVFGVAVVLVLFGLNASALTRILALATLVLLQAMIMRPLPVRAGQDELRRKVGSTDRG